MSERENLINVVVGDRGEGKSKAIVTEWLPVYAEWCGKSKMHVFMTRPNKAYTGFGNLPKGVELHIVSDIKEVEHIVKGLYNGVVFYEDAMTLVGDTLDKETRNMLINSRMCNVDSFFIYHAFGFICKDIMRLADTFTVFKSNESPMVRKDYLSERELKEIIQGMKGLKNGEHVTIQR